MIQKIDFIATKYGLKPLMRTNCNSLEEFKEVAHLCQRHGLFVSRSDSKVKNEETNSENFLVYISKNEKMAKEFAEDDPEYTDDRSKIEYFARSLGYPECCINAHFKLDLGNFSEDKKKEIFFERIQEKNKPFILNDFLYGLGFSLSFYHPCSYRCKKAIKYNKKILEAVRKEDPLYASTIKKCLRLPLLIWFDANSDLNGFLEHRIQLLFKGYLNNSNIFYTAVHIHRRYPGSNRCLSESQLKGFPLSDRCQVYNDKIKIFSENKILKEIEVNNKYHGVLIKFN